MIKDIAQSFLPKRSVLILSVISIILVFCGIADACPSCGEDFIRGQYPEFTYWGRIISIWICIYLLIWLYKEIPAKSPALSLIIALVVAIEVSLVCFILFPIVCFFTARRLKKKVADGEASIELVNMKLLLNYFFLIFAGSILVEINNSPHLWKLILICWIPLIIFINYCLLKWEKKLVLNRISMLVVILSIPFISLPIFDLASIQFFTVYDSKGTPAPADVVCLDIFLRYSWICILLPFLTGAIVYWADIKNKAKMKIAGYFFAFSVFVSFCLLLSRLIREPLRAFWIWML